MKSKRLEVRKAIMSYMSSMMGYETRNQIYKSLRFRVNACKTTVYKYINELINDGALEVSPSLVSEYIALSSAWKNAKAAKYNGKHFYFAAGVTIFTGVRVIGHPHPTKIGVRVGGTYYPSSIIADCAGIGIPERASARFTTVIVWHYLGFDEYGFHQQIPVYETLVFWNSRKAPNGKGLADIAAKTLSPGKELSCRANMSSYTSPRTGKDVTIHNVVPGTLFLGPDSPKQLQRERSVYVGQINFSSRPDKWNIVGEHDHEAWLKIQQWRMDQVFAGGEDMYGYAKVGNAGTLYKL